MKLLVALTLVGGLVLGVVGVSQIKAQSPTPATSPSPSPSPTVSPRPTPTTDTMPAGAPRTGYGYSL